MIFSPFGIKFQQWFLATLKYWFFEWLFVTIGFRVVKRPNLSHKFIWFHWDTSLGNSKLWLCILVCLFASVWPYEWWLICTLFLLENCTPWLAKVLGIFRMIHQNRMVILERISKIHVKSISLKNWKSLDFHKTMFRHER